MILASLLLGAVSAVSFAQSPVLAMQINLDRAGYSCNTIDGVWGEKTERAARAFGWPNFMVATNAPLFKVCAVTQAEIDSLVKIPSDPAAKSLLARMGYESIDEMYAERGHLSRTAIKKLNPHITNWNSVRAGAQITIPNFPPMEEELAAWPKDSSRRDLISFRPNAALLRISLSRLEISAFDAGGKLLARFPCSIARDKKKLPPHGELKITTTIANPNYTYTAEGERGGNVAKKKYIFSPGPNCPVGVVWLGLNLPGYGIHGTPRPESIGNAESHGCFRLANWNAARLYALVQPGTRVIIEE